MPVIAVDPEAKARSTSSTPTPSVAVSGGGGVGWKPRPAASSGRPRSSANIAMMKSICRRREQGARLAHAAQIAGEQHGDHADPEHDRVEARDGIAEVTAATPEATDTATVKM